MREYIERGAVINGIGELFTICAESMPNEQGRHYITEDELKIHFDYVNSIPVADVVEVVRCGECKRRTSGNPNCVGRSKDWFCPLGERR